MEQSPSTLQASCLLVLTGITECLLLSKVNIGAFKRSTPPQAGCAVIESKTSAEALEGPSAVIDAVLHVTTLLAKKANHKRSTTYLFTSAPASVIFGPIEGVALDLLLRGSVRKRPSHDSQVAFICEALLGSRFQ